MTTVNVNLGARSYDIIIGEDLLSRAGEFLAPHLKAKRVAIVTDENVYALHGKTLEAALTDYETHMIIRPAGENQKALRDYRLFWVRCSKPALTAMILS